MEKKIFISIRTFPKGQLISSCADEHSINTMLSKKYCMQKGAYPNLNPAQKMYTFLHTNVSE